MNVNLEEKQILYVFGCESYENTIYRLKWIAILTVDERIQRQILCLIRKLENEKIGEGYIYFYKELRLEMEHYFEAKHYIYKVENCANWEKLIGNLSDSQNMSQFFEGDIDLENIKWK